MKTGLRSRVNEGGRLSAYPPDAPTNFIGCYSRVTRSDEGERKRKCLAGAGSMSMDRSLTRHFAARKVYPRFQAWKTTFSEAYFPALSFSETAPNAAMVSRISSSEWAAVGIMRKRIMSLGTMG